MMAVLCYLSLITRSLLLGCGTMGVAVTAGVLASLDSRSPLHGLSSGQPKWESHTPGTSTPTNLVDDEPTLPSHFIACVKREESASRLREKFRAVVGGEAVEVTVGENASAVQQSDVVLLWYARQYPFHSSVRRIGQLLLTILFLLRPAANHRWRTRFSTRMGSKRVWRGSCSSASLPVSPPRNFPAGSFPAQQ